MNETARAPRRWSGTARITRRQLTAALASVLMVIGAFLATPVLGAPNPTKYFTPEISPSCLAPTAELVRFTLRLTNTNPPGGQSFGSANVSVPAGYAVSPTTANLVITHDPASTTKDWSSSSASDSTIMLRSARSASNSVAPGQSVIVAFSASVPSTVPSPATATWLVAVKQSNDFRGTNNDFALTPGVSQPTTTIQTASCNAPPVAVDDSASMQQAEEAYVDIDVVANDTDDHTPNSALSVAEGSITDVRNGTAVLQGDGRTVRFTPDVGANSGNAPDGFGFTYRVSDGENVSEPALVTVFVRTGTLDCGEDDSVPPDPELNLAGVTVHRLDNVNSTTCVPKDYALTSSEDVIDGDTVNVVAFIPNDSDQEAHYLMEIVWTYEPRTPTDDPSNPATVGGRTFYIDYTGEGTYVPAELCEAVTYDGEGNVTSAVHPAEAPWCITGQDYTIDGDGNIVLHQHWDGFGDPRSY